MLQLLILVQFNLLNQFLSFLQQFLEQQFCAENINFYMAVEDYRSIPDSDVCMNHFFLNHLN